ncbi:MAG TPA: lysyl oxidase family protein [Solirubrobacterales bacterium]|nr:lysyl oxidase family protein [Solirubrobacterales bacterium]
MFRNDPSPRPSRRLVTGIAAALTSLLIAAGAMAPGAGAGAGSNTPLRPDLVTLRLTQDDLVLEPSDGKLFLRLSNQIGNRGPGPLEVYPSASSNNCDGDDNPANDRDVYQRVFKDSNADNVFERGQDLESHDILFGCERYHPAHHHWHVLDFSRYKLVRERSGRTVARSTKIGFCIVDTDHRFASLPGSPPQKYYPAGSEDCDQESIDGLSVGWADTYGYWLPGQQLNVNGLRHGRYCLVSTADPENLLRETDNSNNANRVKIGLHPAKRTVERLPGPCRKQQ